MTWVARRVYDQARGNWFTQWEWTGEGPPPTNKDLPPYEGPADPSSDVPVERPSSEVWVPDEDPIRKVFPDERVPVPRARPIIPDVVEEVLPAPARSNNEIPRPPEMEARDPIEAVFSSVTPGQLPIEEPDPEAIRRLKTYQTEPPPAPNQQPVRQLYAGALGAPSYMWDLAGAIANVVETAPDKRRGVPLSRPRPTPRQPTPVADTLFKAGASARQQVRDWTGATEVPEDVFSRVGKTVGESIIPGGKNAAMLSGITASSRAGTEEAQRFIKSASLKDFQDAPNWIVDAISTPSLAAPADAFKQPPKATVKIESTGGPKEVRAGEFYTVGGIVLASAGMIFGPMIYKRFKTGDVPQLRSVREAVPGTVAISKVKDLARTYDDANAGAINIMRRAGVDPVAAKEVETVMRIQTRATANGMADSAINIGEMQTPAFTFKTAAPLAKVKAAENDALRDYLHIYDTIDEIKRASIVNLSRGGAGNVFVRDYNLIQADNVRRAIEAANPGIQKAAGAYWQNMKDLRKFEATGEYATLSKQEMSELNREWKHEVPFPNRSAGAQSGMQPRGSAVDALAEDMRKRLRDRMQNEAVGKYVDSMRKVMPDTFRPVTAAQLTRNPHWKKNVVEFKRRGEIERYTTDPLLADVLRMDPYFITSMPGQIAYSTKRMLEISTTGELAPWFAATSMYRNWAIGKMTAEQGMKSPTFLGTHMAIPRQLLPQMANSIAGMLDRGSAGWLSSVFGQGNMQALSTRLANAYQNSLYHKLQTVGGGRGSILQQQTSANNKLTKAIQNSTGFAKGFLEAYRSLLNAGHNAAAFDYARRNQGRVALPELAQRSRHMTGDPRIGGEYFTNLPGAGQRAIRFENDASRVSHTMGQILRRTYGPATEVGRTAIPWYNATVQGMKRIGQSYIEDPTKFTARAWLYYIAPTASLYTATHALGTDPNGTSYVDYMMNRRSEYNKIMNWYIPIPGRPAEEGIEFPAFHELAPVKYFAQVTADHAFSNSYFSEQEDFYRGSKGIADVLTPPLPPVFGWWGASQGLVTSQGVFGNEAYRRRFDPFDQNGGLPAGMELYMRAIAPGIGDVFGTGAAAFTRTPEGFMQSLWNGAKAAGSRVIQKTPVVRDIVGIKAPMMGNNQITEELFTKNKEIRQLENYYRQWTLHQGLIGATSRGGELQPNIRSRSGEDAAIAELGERPPMPSAGINQPPPTNPLYTMFIEDLHTKFAGDATTNRRGEPTGAIGFQSLWLRYNIATRHLERIKKVDVGNNVTWTRQLEQFPDQVDYLRRNGVNPKDIAQVRNFYEKQRQDAARVILTKVRAVERDFSQKLGRPITLKDIDPYKKGLSGDDTQIDLVPDIQ
jgi:hypothetical protein